MSNGHAPAPSIVDRLIALPLDQSLAVIFPGQGSQKVGMGLEACAASATARAVYEIADQTLGFALSSLCAEGPADELTLTANAQPAILATSIAILVGALEGGDLDRRPAFAAGHSLGQYSALVAAGSLALEDALRLVRERGQLMGEAKTGTLAAIVGLDEQTVTEICQESGAEVANYNAPTQTVVGGTPVAVERACALAKERGGRGIPVNVSGAFHTSLMEPAARAFAEVLHDTEVRDPVTPVIGNVSAEPLGSAEDVRADLGAQIRSPVRWYQSMDFLQTAGVLRVMEVGPGQVLTNQLKRSHPGLEYYPWVKTLR